jgi:hypothetical protein
MGHSLLQQGLATKKEKGKTKLSRDIFPTKSHNKKKKI